MILTLLLAFLTSPAFAQDEVTIPAATDGEIPGVVQMVAPSSKCMAVSDSLRLLVIGVGGEEPRLEFFRIDNTGKPAEKPHATFPLPRAESLKKFPQYVSAIAFHPRSAVLYVWLDINGPAVGKPEENPVFRDFDHLLVFSIVDAQPRLIRPTCRGSEFGYGLGYGCLAINPAGNRLFYPYAMVGTARAAGVGYVDLDSTGYPIVEEGKAKTHPENVAVFTVHPYQGFAAFESNLVFAAAQGPAVWDIDNRRARLTSYYLIGGSYTFRLAAHPAISALYLALAGTGQVCRVEHANGYPTLLPQRVTFNGAAFNGAPTIMPKRKALAMGGVNRLYLLGLDARGRFMAEGSQMALIAPIVQSMAYSDQFDKLYVAVEKLPDPPKPAEPTAAGKEKGK